MERRSGRNQRAFRAGIIVSISAEISNSYSLLSFLYSAEFTRLRIVPSDETRLRLGKTTGFRYTLRLSYVRWPHLSGSRGIISHESDC
jgi:hypothetical protein